MTAIARQLSLSPLVASMIIACGGGASPSPQPAHSASAAPAPAEESAPAPEVAEPAPAEPPTLAPSYVLHEWGFIAASLTDARVSAVAGPRGLSSVAHAFGGLGHVGVGAGGKPVLYFHLDDGGEEFSLSVGIQPAGAGQLLEHFPPGELSADQRILRWPNVRVTRGACRGTYPAVGDAACHVADGLCERAELSGYESAGADCVNVGDQRTGVLFYRSGPADATLPLAVTRRPRDVVRLAHVNAAGPTRAGGWVMRIARGDDRTQSRVRIVALGSGRHVDVPPAVGDGTVGAEEAIAQLRAAVVAGGLDEPETNAFMAAWTNALFGAAPEPAPEPPPPGTIGMGRTVSHSHPLGSVADAVIYLLPQASVDALLPLELTPAPRSLQRVFLARVSLSAEPLVSRLSTLTVEGGLAADVARRVVRRHANQFRACADLEGAEPGRLTMRLQVRPDGAVEGVTFEGMELAAQPRACFTSLARRLVFPAVEAPSNVAQVLLLSR